MHIWNISGAVWLKDGAESMNTAPGSGFTAAEAELFSPRTEGHFGTTAPSQTSNFNSKWSYVPLLMSVPDYS